jgi:hypothetical protein
MRLFVTVLPDELSSGPILSKPGIIPLRSNKVKVRVDQAKYGQRIFMIRRKEGLLWPSLLLSFLLLAVVEQQRRERQSCYTCKTNPICSINSQHLYHTY